MIKKLDHRDLRISKEIYRVFQISYIIEAKLLDALDFPPLKRTIGNIQESNTEFYGYCLESNLAAVIEIEKSNIKMHICSLVVDPLFFRQGIANKFLKFTVELSNSDMITVETGLANQPAINLYENFGFKMQGHWMTSVGIEKVKFLFNKNQILIQNKELS